MTADPAPCRHVVLSGCSGGGKSTLLGELKRRGYGTVPEPGRRIVAEELQSGGTALPWCDLAAFATRALALAAEDRTRTGQETDWVFFDRGLVDAAVALDHAGGQAAAITLARFPRYHRTVFLTPPWPDIYQKDGERRHDLDEARAEYGRLIGAYRALGYRTVVLPLASVEERADVVLGHLRAEP